MMIKPIPFKIPSSFSNGIFKILVTLTSVLFLSPAGHLFDTINASGLDTWYWTNPQPPTGRSIRKVVFGNQTYVAVGDQGVILTSKDKLTWTDRRPLGNKANLDAIFGNGIFVVVGEGGQILTSNTGTDWTTRVSNTDKTLVSIAYGNGIYVAVGDQGQISRSTNATAWQNEKSNTSMNLSCVTFGNGKFVAIGGQGFISTSTDGSSWEPQINNITESLTSIVFANDMFITGPSRREFGNNQHSLITSRDGINWIDQGLSDWNGGRLTYGNGKFISTYGFPCGDIMMVSRCFSSMLSTDLIKWDPVSTVREVIAYSNGYFWLRSNGLSWSSNGELWDYPPPDESPYTSVFGKIIYGNNLFVAYASIGGISGIYTSQDRMQWNLKYPVAPVTTSETSIVYGNSTFVFVSVGSKIVVSKDGESWSEISDPKISSLYAVTYADNQFVAVGDKGNIVTSYDGIIWTLRSYTPGHKYTGVAYGNNQFITICNESPFRIITSPDGTNWTERTVAGFPASQFREADQIAYGANKFIVSGYWDNRYSLALSSDGIDWNSISCPIGECRNIDYIGGYLFAYYGSIAYSSNGGINWAGIPLPGSGGIIYSVLHINNKISISGTFGVIQSERPQESNSALRSLPSTYIPGSSLSVSILVTANDNTQVYTVEETPPSGWVTNEIDNGGQWDSTSQKIKWGPFFDNTDRIFRYNITPPADTTGPKSFIGLVSFDGNGLAISGNSSILPATSTTTTTSILPTSSTSSTSSSSTSTSSTTSTTLYFREDFVGGTLDNTRWEAFPNGGSVVVGSGRLILFTNQNSQFFPYIRSRFNPFPLTGDFSLKLGLRFLSTAPFGTGFFTAKILPENLTFIPDNDSLGPISIWQGDSSYWIGLNGEIAYQKPAPHQDYHDYEFRRRESKGQGVYEVYVDGQFIKAFPETTSAHEAQNNSDILFSRNENIFETSVIGPLPATVADLSNMPTGVWFGNPYVTQSPGQWTSFELDYLEVRSMDYSALSSTSTSTTSTSTTTSTSLKSTSTTLCTASPMALCLNDRQFSASVDYVNYNNGVSGQGVAVPLTNNSGYFWFFNQANVELIVKALDGRSVNGNFWFFYGALSDVEYNIRVIDSRGRIKTYHNPAHTMASVSDVGAFTGVSSTNLLSKFWEALGLRPLSDLAKNISRASLGRSSLAESFQQSSGCSSGGTSLCLNQNRFRLQVGWRNYNTGQTGSGQAVPLTGDSGYFWFFNANNIELVVKILDGRSLNGKFWVLYGALTDVEYNIAITDTVTGATKNYYNPPRNLTSRADVNAF